MMAENCCTLVRGCPHYRAFKGEVPKALLCPIRAYAPLELVHLDYTSIESTMELNKPPIVRNIIMTTDCFMRYALVVVTKDQTAKTVMKVFYECFIAAYHAQCNGQVVHFHQMLFHMIGKLAHNKKAQWEEHLPELLQAYNSTQSLVTGFSPHHLMFRRHPCLPVDYYFLMVSAFEHSCCVPAYVTEVRRCFKEAYAEAHLQMNCKAKKQKW